MDSVLRHLEEDLVLHPEAPSMRVVDVGTLLPRLALASPETLVGSNVLARGWPVEVSRLLSMPPLAVVGAALSLYSLDDAQRLQELSRILRARRSTTVGSVTYQVVQGVLLLKQRDFEGAVQAFEVSWSELFRIGGSNVEREAVEDMYIHALIGSGRVAEATRRVDARLARRPSSVDFCWPAVSVQARAERGGLLGYE